MKTSSDPRHLKRKKVIEALFAEGFTHQKNLPQEALDIQNKTGELDVIIKSSAPTWPVDKINRIDLAILRYSVYELQRGEVPPKVIIDEAVELAKEYGSDASSSFVNGVLGSVYEKIIKK